LRRAGACCAGKESPGDAGADRAGEHDARRLRSLPRSVACRSGGALAVRGGERGDRDPRACRPPGAGQGVRRCARGPGGRGGTGVLGRAGRRARVRVSADAPEGLAVVEAMDPSALGFLVLVSVLRAIERTPEEGPVRVTVRDEGARVVLHVQDGGREEGDETEVEQALAAAAREYGAEIHVRGSQLRLSFLAGETPAGTGSTGE